MKKETKKYLNSYIRIRGKVDKILHKQGLTDREKLENLLIEEREAKLNYYNFLAKDSGWSQKELDDLLAGTGLRGGKCAKNRCFKKISKIFTLNIAKENQKY